MRWSINIDRAKWNQWSPLSFRAFRRLVDDGDFNVDVPIANLLPGDNTVTIAASFRDGRVLTKEVAIVKETGACLLPLRIDWAMVKNPQDVGQIVDGRWEPGGRTVARGGR